MTPIADGWIDDAPVQWTRGRIKNLIASSNNGTWGDEPVEDGSDVHCIRAADFDRVGRRAEVNGAPLRSIDASSLRRHLLHPGDLILEKSGGGEKQPVGMAVLYEGAKKAVCSNFCSRISPAADVDSRYLTYVFAAAYGQGLTQSAIKQTTGIQNLDAGVFFSSPWAYPELEEQRRIADFLDAETVRIDGLVVLRAQQRTLLEQRLRVSVREQFQDIETVPTRLKFLLTARPRYGVLVPKFEDNGVKFIRVNDLLDLDGRAQGLITISSEVSAQYPTTVVRENDILVSVVGTLGRAAVAPASVQGANVNRAIAVLRPLPWVDRELLAAWINGDDFETQAMLATGNDSAQRTLGMEDMSNFALPWPREEAVQAKLAAEVHNSQAVMRELGRRLSVQTAVLEERRQALITAAVTGQFDVSTASGRSVTDGVTA
ncbi:restriction endonuclease subunit S [Streptomyces shenzhenensis]|uniref:restriction endonuclease subunit S n=1 Tax=Streptomyces shenzhenensis TaxID=943815 RepID=UPI0015F080C4|nr:restriction endonuclease subunit S [Streptomyces shenzhenensis]